MDPDRPALMIIPILIIVGVLILGAGVGVASEAAGLPPLDVLLPTPDLSGDNMSGRAIPIFVTSYWPSQSGMSAAQQLMEGGQNDRKGKPLHTLQDAQAGIAPYCSVACDYTVFPYGLAVKIPSIDPSVTFRLVDTGGHFYGSGKVTRLPGHEPFDICVVSSAEHAPGGAATAYVPDETDVL